MLAFAWAGPTAAPIATVLMLALVGQIDLTNNLLANKEPTRTRTYTLAPLLFLAMGIGAIATDIFLRR